MTVRTGSRRLPVLFAAMAVLVVALLGLPFSSLQAQTPAAQLTGLSLSSGTLRPAFDPAVTEYRAAVKHNVMQITVTGTAASGVTVTYNDATGVALADADDSTAGHQVNLGLGETVFQVVAASGSDTETYTVTMERDASAFLGWTPTKDIDLDGENTDAVGMWSDGTTLWVADSADAKLYAYTLATRTRDSGGDIALHADNADPTGIWSDGTTLWVADDTDDKLYAYTLSSETRDDTRDITLDADNDNPSALWGNTTHIYVAENERNDDTIYAYTIDTGAAGGDRDPDKDVDGGRWNGETTAIWSDGTTLWGSEADASVVMAYSLETGIWAGKQFYLPSNQFAASGMAAMWSDGTTVWFKEDIADGKLYSYNLPSVAGTTTLSAFSITYGSSGTEAALRPAFALNEHSYEAAVPSSASRITIAAAANDSSSTLQLLDSRGLLADADTAAGHQVGVTVGFAPHIPESHVVIRGRADLHRANRAGLRAHSRPDAHEGHRRLVRGRGCRSGGHLVRWHDLVGWGQAPCADLCLHARHRGPRPRQGHKAHHRHRRCLSGRRHKPVGERNHSLGGRARQQDPSLQAGPQRRRQPRRRVRGPRLRQGYSDWSGQLRRLGHLVGWRHHVGGGHLWK